VASRNFSGTGDPRVETSAAYRWQDDEPNPIPDMKRPAERIYRSHLHGLASV
jgi:hypothetical protein